MSTDIRAAGLDGFDLALLDHCRQGALLEGLHLRVVNPAFRSDHLSAPTSGNPERAGFAQDPDDPVGGSD